MGNKAAKQPDPLAPVAMPPIVKWLKATNFINAILLLITGISAFILLSFSLIVLISAIYIMVFGWMMCCFELHLARFEKQFLKFVGFMFYWQGRTVFLLLVGLLSFGEGIVGIVTGIYTLINLIFNWYVLFSNPYYQRYVKYEQQQAILRASSGSQQVVQQATIVATKMAMDPSSVSAEEVVAVGAAAGQVAKQQAQIQGAKASASINQAKANAQAKANQMQAQAQQTQRVVQQQAQQTAKNVSNAANNASRSVSKAANKMSASVGQAAAGQKSTPQKVVWQEFTDDDSGQPYYYNPKTGETRWELPDDASMV